MSTETKNTVGEKSDNYDMSLDVTKMRSSDTYTFQDKEKGWTWVVKKEFLKDCPQPETLSEEDLNGKHCAFEFLHNPDGPAIYRHKDGAYEYWLDGKRLAIENADFMKKIAHNFGFKHTLKTELDRD